MFICRPGDGGDRAKGFLVEDRHVCLRGVDVSVAEQAGDDVDGKAAGDGLGGKHAAEVVWPVLSAVWFSCGLVDGGALSVRSTGGLPVWLDAVF